RPRLLRRRRRIRTRRRRRDRIRRLAQQIAEEVRRKVRPRSDFPRQHGIVRGALRQSEKGLVAQPRTAIFRQLAQDLATAAANQQFAQRLRYGGAARDCEQIRLSLARGKVDEIVIGEPGRAFEYGAGDLDRLVVREQPYHPDGSAIEW